MPIETDKQLKQELTVLIKYVMADRTYQNIITVKCRREKIKEIC